MSRRRKPKRDSLPEPRDSQRRAALAVCGFLVLAVAAVFGQTVDHGFVNYDDNEYVYENPHVARGLTADGIAWAFTSGHANNWHPLTWLSHELDCQLYGQRAGGHHLTSVVLHAVTAIVLFLVLWQMTGGLWPSAFVAAVFAVHPLRVESVAWVAERKDVLSGLFFVLTLWAYLAYVRRPFSLARYLTVAVLFALGLMSKPMLVTLPFVLLLLDYWPLGRTAAEPARRLIVEKIPLLLLTVASCVITPLAQGKAVIALEKLPLSSRIGNALVSYVAYAGETFWPANLAVFYPLPSGPLPAWKPLAALLVLLGVTAAALLRRQRNPYLPVGWLWYLGMLVPVIGVVQVGSHAMADRYTYLPQIGLCIAVTWGALYVVRAWPHRAWTCGAVASVLLAALMACAARQTSYWRDSEALWTRAVDCTSPNNLAHSNLGAELARLGRFDKAIVQYEAALAIMPNDAESHSNLGNALAALGRADEAIEQYEEAVRIKPGYAEAHSNLGAALVKLGRLDLAVAQYEEALRIRPDYVEARCNLGNALARLRRFDEAIAQYQKALDLQPDHAQARRCLNHVLSLRAKANAK